LIAWRLVTPDEAATSAYVCVHDSDTPQTSVHSDIIRRRGSHASPRETVDRLGGRLDLQGPVHFDENFWPATTGAEPVAFLFGLPQMAQAVVMQVSSATARD